MSTRRQRSKPRTRKAIWERENVPNPLESLDAAFAFIAYMHSIHAHCSCGPGYCCADFCTGVWSDDWYEGGDFIGCDF